MWPLILRSHCHYFSSCEYVYHSRHFNIFSCLACAMRAQRKSRGSIVLSNCTKLAILLTDFRARKDQRTFFNESVYKSWTPNGRYQSCKNDHCTFHQLMVPWVWTLFLSLFFSEFEVTCNPCGVELFALFLFLLTLKYIKPDICRINDLAVRSIAMEWHMLMRTTKKKVKRK